MKDLELYDKNGKLVNLKDFLEENLTTKISVRKRDFDLKYDIITVTLTLDDVEIHKCSANFIL